MLKYKIGKKNLKTGKITYSPPQYSLTEVIQEVIKMNNQQRVYQPEFWYTYEPEVKKNE